MPVLILLQCIKINTGILHGELLIDAGAFITGIEFASGKEAILIGKPSPLYFKAALESIGAKIENGFYMIGDDIENDTKAAAGYWRKRYSYLHW
ncbi:MAG: HAD hydrolase-like protein [Ignavibacteriales bacterium]|nr:HAD hydrolase-like protein [Ignavibacteriales bacterium]